MITRLRNAARTIDIQDCALKPARARKQASATPHTPDPVPLAGSTDRDDQLTRASAASRIRTAHAVAIRCALAIAVYVGFCAGSIGNVDASTA